MKAYKLSATTILLACHAPLSSSASTFLSPPSSSLRGEVLCNTRRRGITSNKWRDVEHFSFKMEPKNQNSNNEIQEAIRKEEKFGKGSDEARVAWDIVEEVNASRYHQRSKGRTTSLSSSSSPTKELIHQVDFMNNIHNLSKILSYVWKPATPHTLSLLETLSQIYSNHLKTTKIGSMPEKLANAIAETKVECTLHGPNNSQTKEALKRAVDISKLSHEEYKNNDDGHHEYKSVLDKNALDDAMDNIRKIEHLMNLLEIENKRLGEKLV